MASINGKFIVKRVYKAAGGWVKRGDDGVILGPFKSKGQALKATKKVVLEPVKEVVKEVIEKPKKKAISKKAVSAKPKEPIEEIMVKEDEEEEDDDWDLSLDEDSPFPDMGEF